jgi:hypothetical protein
MWLNLRNLPGGLRKITKISYEAAGLLVKFVPGTHYMQMRGATHPAAMSRLLLVRDENTRTETEQVIKKIKENLKTDTLENKLINNRIR